MGDFLFWGLVFFLGFCAVSAIGAIAQAIALKHYTAEGDPRDVAEEERARTIARVLAEAEAKQALAVKAAKEIDHVLHPSPDRQNWNSQRRLALADLRLRSPEAAAEAERRLEVIEEQERVREEQREAEYERQRMEREAAHERRRLERNAQRRAHYLAKKSGKPLPRRAKKKVRIKSNLPLVTRISPGKYACDGGYQILHDNGESGTGKWIVSQDPDNPLAFCRTLKGTRRFIHLALKAGDAPTR